MSAASPRIHRGTDGIAMAQPAARDAYDVIVVGAGIVGMSAAWQLAAAGRRVLLIDKGRPGGEQSSRNWGWIRLNGRNLRELDAALAGRALWDELVVELGADVDFHAHGNLQLAYDDAELERFARWQRAASERGLRTELLDRAQVRKLFPELGGAFIGASYSPRDGGANPHLVVAALANHLASRVTVEADTSVLTIETTGTRVRGVLTERGRRQADSVILAAGAWTSRLLLGLGLRLPQRKVRGTVLETTPLPPLPRVAVWARRVALRQTASGSFIVAGDGAILDHDFESLRFLTDFERTTADADRRGGRRQRVGMALLRDVRYLLGARASFWRDTRADEPQPDFAGAFQTLSQFRSLHPAFAAAGIARTWAGNIDYTPDAVPVIQRFTQPDGLVIATGFSGHGFALGPVGGALAADLAIGVPPRVDVRNFRLTRFGERDLALSEPHF